MVYVVNSSTLLHQHGFLTFVVEKYEKKFEGYTGKIPSPTPVPLPTLPPFPIGLGAIKRRQIPPF